MKYLKDMQDAVKHALEVAYEMTIANHNRIPSPVELRREIKPWFISHYSYAMHHINPVCRSAVAMLRSYKKHNGKLRIPVVKKLKMRIDRELFKVEGNRARVTLQPYHYSRQRKKIQKHIHNRQKRYKKLRQTKGRQKNRVNDALQKLSTQAVKANPEATFVFENLNGIRKNGDGKGKKFRTQLNRWPYRLYQKNG